MSFALRCARAAVLSALIPAGAGERGEYLDDDLLKSINPLPTLRDVASLLPLPAWELIDPELDPLIAEIQAHAGANMTHAAEDRHEPIEAELRPLVMAMPKNEEGKLGPEAVRYTLHRFFVQRHGWFVKGLSPNGGAWNASSPTDLLDGHVAPGVKEVFESRLRSSGLGIHETALLAAVLEQSVHDEQLQALRAAFNVLGLSTEGGTQASDVEHAINLYLAGHVTGHSISELDPEQATLLLARISKYYPAFPATADFARQVRAEVMPNKTRFTFPEVAAVVRVIGSRYGRYQNGECVNLKGKLIAAGDNSTGCVRLSDFYDSMLKKGMWEFSEAPEVLREQGILEESTPDTPYVLIANYVNSATNCVAHSSYYSVCCINECDAIYGHIERRVQASHITANQLLIAVSSFAPGGVATRVPQILQDKLREVAAQNRGLVPLYGRLFAQWMHHMFPRECPFPHLSGTTIFQEFWHYDETAKGGTKHLLVSPELAEQYTSKASSLAPEGGPTSLGGCAAWRAEEEVFVPTFAPPPPAQQLESDSSPRITVYVVAAISFAVVLVLAVARAVATATRASGARSFVPLVRAGPVASRK